MLSRPSFVRFRHRLTLIGACLVLVVVAIAATMPGVDLGRVVHGKAPFRSSEQAAPATPAIEGRVNGQVPVSKRVPGSFIVQLAPGLDPKVVGPELARDYGGEAAFVYDHVLGGFAFRGPDDARSRISNDPRVSNVDDDVTIPVADTCQWSGGGSCRPELNSMRAPQAWDINPSNTKFRGANAVVAILDTGVNLDPAFASNVLLRDGTCASGSVNDTFGHGTRVTGTAVGNLGVLPLGQVISIKIGSSGTTASAMTCGVNRVASLVDGGQTIHAANLSFATTSPISGVQAALKDLRDGTRDGGITGKPRVLITAAAGNVGGSNVEYPARYSETVAVSATNVANTSLASFSDRGAEVDLAAPGDNITTVQGSATGTSYSAPQAAAAAALVRSINPSLDPLQTLDVLQKKGICPPGATLDANLDGGDCNGPNRSGDSDGIPEPALNVEGAARGVDPPPVVTFNTPIGGGQVNGTRSIQVNATDNKNLAASGFALTVAGVALTGPSCTAPSTTMSCTYSWNTATTAEDQVAAIVATVTDVDSGAGTANDTAVPNNTNNAPAITWIAPTTNGGTVSAQPSFQARFRVVDDNNALSSVTLKLDGNAVALGPPSAGVFTANIGPLADGSTHTLAAAASDGVNTSNQSITVNISVALFRENFDSAPAGWIFTGSSSLWHRTSACGGTGATPPYLYYGIDGSCTFNNGVANTGYVTTPVLTGLPQTYTLTLRSKEQTESCSSCSRDRRDILVDYGDGSGFRVVSSRNARTFPGAANWEQRSFQLGSCTTSQVRIRFLFKSKSTKNNSFFGWGVDDVTITPSGGTCTP